MHTLDTSSLNLLYIETYPSGSHGRVLDLIRRHSDLRVDEICCSREHWRWLAIAAHYAVIEHIQQRHDNPPDIIVCSGPLNLSALVAMLPANWRDVPRVMYLHESQWTYPAPPSDPRPYLLAHLDAATVANEVWFNSHFHLDMFWSAATSVSAPDRVRALAGRLRPSLESRFRVVYPPVAIDTDPQPLDGESPLPVIIWNARWEQDKRPDRFVRLLDQLALGGCRFAVTVLGTGSSDVESILADLGAHTAQSSVPGHLTSRSDYEALLSTGDVFISTADHEFFGVSALESALLGVRPILPRSLAYPETLPSAYFYEPGSIEDLARVTRHVLNQAETLPAHRSDARRYGPERCVPAFDAHCSRIVAEHRA